MSKLSIIKDALKVRAGRQHPFKLTFAVTYRCNSKCTSCNIWKTKLKNELSLEEIKEFFNKNRFQWLNLTGGEVFLRNDVVDIVKSVPSLEILSITTNGILTDKIVADAKEILNHAKTLTMTVSIDGPENMHNKIRGTKSWKQAVETLKQLKSLEKVSSGLKVFVGYTISPMNAGMLQQTYESLKRYVPVALKDFHVNIYHSSAVYFKNKPVDMSSIREKIMQDVNAVLKEKRGMGPITILERRYMKRIEEYMETGKCPMPCKALAASIFIDPQGDVYPCTMMDERLGNVRESSLKNILLQDKAQDVLKKIKSGKCPQCWTACEAYQTILCNW